MTTPTTQARVTDTVDPFVLRSIIADALEAFCDATFNGLERAHFIEYRTDGKTPADAVESIALAIEQND